MSADGEANENGAVEGDFRVADADGFGAFPGQVHVHFGTGADKFDLVCAGLFEREVEGVGVFAFEGAPLERRHAVPCIMTST